MGQTKQSKQKEAANEDEKIKIKIGDTLLIRGKVQKVISRAGKAKSNETANCWNLEPVDISSPMKWYKRLVGFPWAVV